MYKFFLLVCLMALSACEDQPLVEKDQKASVQDSAIERQKSAGNTVAPVVKELDLDISPEMMEPELVDDEDVQKNLGEDGVLSIPAKDKNDRVKFKGQILLDDSEEMNIDAVDGAVIEMEIKLK